MGYLKRIKGDKWIAKYPDVEQNISQMGTKWNELDEEMAAMRGRNLRDEFNKWVEDSVND